MVKKQANTSVKAGVPPKLTKPVAANDASDPTPELIYKRGAVRPFLVTTPSTKWTEIRAFTKSDRLYLVVLIAVSFFVRLQKLYQPDSVVFDEVHFGGFASKYIRGTFFMDVHPPLAKMLYAGVASMAGYKGDFSFEKIGLEYGTSVPYFYMRGFSALLGLATVILFFLTLKSSGVRSTVALAASLLFSFENAYVTISRYILLDAPLMFFIAASAYSFKRFQSEVPFTFKWYRALLATGVALGLAVSSKWVGLFTIAWIGVLNIYDLWFLIGDLSLSTCKIVKQTVSRGVVLLGTPILLYILFFSIHFAMLYKEGDGGPFMTSAFRSTLEGNKIPGDIYANVGVSSVVSIRHIATQGGYLHSHDHMYETGSKQQQITLYPHLDANNLWKVELYNVTEPPMDFEQITDGTKIRLKHIMTHRRLHSHDHKCPVTDNDWQKEATCYGYEGFQGDANDDFVVEIQKKFTKKIDAQTNLRALESVFRLRHAMTGCYLFSHEVKLPKWAFEQQEVTCATQGVLDKSLWYVEHNENEYLPEDAEKISYTKPSLLSKIFESHKKMWQINENLKAPHNFESSPSTWPFLLRGINYWGESHRQVYLLGNAPVWWTVTILVFVFSIYAVVQVLKWQLNVPVGDERHVFNFNTQTFHFLLGWAFHYFPSFLMGRQMFLHHYLPAYYFGILALAQFFDVLVTYVFSRKRSIAYGIIAVFVATAFIFYVNYSPIIYGGKWTKNACYQSKALSGWDYDCEKYFSSLSEYDKPTQSTSFLSAQTGNAIDDLDQLFN